jgi:DNA-binding HxlR family transcriptional regulator
LSDLMCASCPMINLIDRKWVRRILKTLVIEGPLRFSELEKQLAGISPKTLTERLRDLEEKEMVIRTVYPEVPIRVEYRLTERGIEVANLVVATCDWVKKWYPNTTS